jgi:hypothetical protein
MNYKIKDVNEIYFAKALGLWEIKDSKINVKIYVIITENSSITDIVASKDLFFVEPYEIDVININDIDTIGYTRRPINADILSGELKKMVEIKEPNKTSNRMVRNIYTMDYITSTGRPEKNYRYFSIVPELARENISGLDLVSSPGLIRKYIFGLWP